MFQYRELTKLTDEEIKFALQDIFPEITEFYKIERSEKWNTIRCDVNVTSEQHLVEIVLRSVGIVCNGPYHFTINADQNWRWLQYLMAKGCHPLQRDNPYIE